MAHTLAHNSLADSYFPMYYNYTMGRYYLARGYDSELLLNGWDYYLQFDPGPDQRWHMRVSPSW
jgi:hypothetical protein